MLKLHEFIHQELRRLHALFDRATGDLSPEEWHATPSASSNSVAFIMWHYARTEDNIVRFILQDRRPTVWAEGGWAEKLGLPPVAQGTGMSLADAQGLRLDDTEGFRRYIQATWASSDEYLSAPDESAFERVVTVRPLGEMPGIRALGQVCVAHGFGHLGHIDMLRSFFGKPGVGI